MEKLIKFRKSLGLLQKDVAQAIGIKSNTYCCYERGINEPSIQVLIKLADFFHTTVDELINRENNSDIFSDARIPKPESQILFESLTPDQQALILERMRAYNELNHK